MSERLRTPVEDVRTRLARHVVEQGFFEAGTTALLAVSGGPDSLALLFLLHDLAPSAGLTVAVGHVDHGIHPDSRMWADDVAGVAARLGVPCRRTRLELGASASETLARRERYRALRAMQREMGARYLATAHHADDQIETVLLRFLRGSGPAGLAGIPAVGPDGLVRPLLPFTRVEVGDWLRQRAPDVVPRVDPANVDPRHDRAWVRTALLPLVRARFADTDRRLIAAARLAQVERAAWRRLLDALPALEFRVTNGGAEVARGPLARYDKALSVALLRTLARAVGRSLGLARAERLAAFVRAAPSGRRVELGGGWTAEIVFDRLRIEGPAGAGSPTQGPAAPVTCGDGDRGEASWGDWCITWRREPAGRTRRTAFTTWLTPGAFAVRGWHSGERMRPVGGVGRRPVRRLLMEARVPVRARRHHPVLSRGPAILWIPGVCRSDAALPNPGEPAVRVDARRIGHSEAHGRSGDR
ncbi:MAG: tRNA lysidine(34) synthetase TilS [Gemmatimonadota bacterium]|nr:tRNA lysidine(34) synthetase TilS [Gemmatimonadota bacterium]